MHSKQALRAKIDPKQLSKHAANMCKAPNAPITRYHLVLTSCRLCSGSLGRLTLGGFGEEGGGKGAGKAPQLLSSLKQRALVKAEGFSKLRPRPDCPPLRLINTVPSRLTLHLSESPTAPCVALRFKRRGAAEASRHRPSLALERAPAPHLQSLCRSSLCRDVGSAKLLGSMPWA